MLGQRLFDRELGYVFYHPVKIFFAYRMNISVGRGIQEVDCVWNSVLYRELHGVEIVSERLAKRARIPDYPVMQLVRTRAAVPRISQVMRLFGVVGHHAN